MSIYVASKTKHADLWKAMRAAGYPINSTWIDEAGVGETLDFNDLWTRCINEAAYCDALVVYREPDDVLKGAWVELGAALSHDRPVMAVGLRDFTIAKYDAIQHFDHINSAMMAALKSVPGATPSLIRADRAPEVTKEK